MADSEAPRGFQALKKIQRGGSSSSRITDTEGGEGTPRSRGLDPIRRRKLELADRKRDSRRAREESDGARERSESPRASRDRRMRRQGSSRRGRAELEADVEPERPRRRRSRSSSRRRGRRSSSNAVGADDGSKKESEESDGDAHAKEERDWHGDDAAEARRRRRRRRRRAAESESEGEGEEEESEEDAEEGSGESGESGESDESDGEEDEDDDAPIEVGERVQLRQGRRFHPGTISRVRSDGTYDVDLDNGDHDSRVAPTFIQTERPKKKKKKAKKPKKPKKKKAKKKTKKTTKQSDNPQLFLGAEVEVVDGGRGRIARCLYDEYVYDVDMRSGPVMRRVAQSRIELRSELHPGDVLDVKSLTGAQKYRGAVIDDVHDDNLLSVTYDDSGERESDVARSRVRLLPPFYKGDEVQALTAHGAWVAATVTNARSNGTYDVRSAAGDKLARLPRSKLRSPVAVVSSGAFPLHAAVEMYVPSETHEVRYVAGAVSWVHADGCSYVVEAEDGAVFDRVPRAHLRPPGGATGETPPASLSELSLFLVRLWPELLAYLLFFYGVAVEISQAIGVLDDTSAASDAGSLEAALAAQGDVAWAQTCARAHLLDASYGGLIGNSSTGQLHCALDLDAVAVPRDWLALFVVLLVLGLAVMLGFLVYYLRQKIHMLRDHRVDHRETQLNTTARARMVVVWLGMLGLSALSIAPYSALLVRLYYYCFWDGEFDAEPFSANPFEGRHAYDSLADELEAVMSRVAFNLCRGYFLLLVVEGANSLEMRLFLVVPAVLATSVAVAKVVSSLGVLHYVSRRAAEDGDFELTTEIDLAVANVCLSLYLAAVLAHVLFGLKRHADLRLHALRRGGELPDDALRAAKLGDYGLLAQEEARTEEGERRERASSMCSVVFQRLASLWLLHAAAAAASFVAATVLNDYVGGEDSETDTFDVDMGLAACWAVVHAAAPLARCMFAPEQQGCCGGVASSPV